MLKNLLMKSEDLQRYRLQLLGMYILIYYSYLDMLNMAEELAEDKEDFLTGNHLRFLHLGLFIY